jgi:hypothetical protein
VLKSRFFIFSFIIWILLVSFAFSQIDLPRPSPHASVAQTIGITHAVIDYYSPGVKERVIWGKLVPYNEIWRTGANHCTTISFDTDVKVEGKAIPVGKYSLFTIPGKQSWTVILNKDTSLWGTMGYKESDDVTRFTVKPQNAEFRERMMFAFDNVTNDSVMVALYWEKLKVPFTLAVNTDSLVMAEADQAINWRTPYQAADYGLQNNLDMTKVRKWLDLSLAVERNYWNSTVLARVQDKEGKRKEAIKTLEAALQMGKTMERIPFNIQDMEAMLQEWKKK